MKKDKRYRFRKLEFWAEKGMVCVIDERFNENDERSFNVVPRVEFLKRTAAINEELKRHTFKYADERNEYLGFIENSIKVLRQAKEQGDPLDPRSLEQFFRDRRRSYVYGNGTARSAITAATPSAEAPENAVLPAIPQADPNKPFADSCTGDSSG